jgi:hypothetical protein
MIRPGRVSYPPTSDDEHNQRYDRFVTPDLARVCASATTAVAVHLDKIPSGRGVELDVLVLEPSVRSRALWPMQEQLLFRHRPFQEYVFSLSATGTSLSRCSKSEKAEMA